MRSLWMESVIFLQIRDINSGTFGFVELALDKTTGQQVAIKFIDRGEKVDSLETLLLLAFMPNSFCPPVEHRPQDIHICFIGGRKQLIICR